MPQRTCGRHLIFLAELHDDEADDGSDNDDEGDDEPDRTDNDHLANFVCFAFKIYSIDNVEDADAGSIIPGEFIVI